MGGGKSKPLQEGSSQVQSMSKVDLAGDLDPSGKSPRNVGVVVSKEVLDGGLGDQPCPLHQKQHEEFEITNYTTKKVKFKFDPIPSDQCRMVFTPNSGTINSAASVRISASLELLEQVSLNFRVNLRLNNGKETKFLNVRCHADQGVFGVDIKELELVDDHGYQVPKILAQMRAYMEENDAFVQEGIFRLAGDAAEMTVIKKEMNSKKSFIPGDKPDVNAIANLLKVFFRDMATPVLNVLPNEVVFKSGDQEKCIAAFNTLPEPNKSLMDWLIDMLAEVTRSSDVNKMTPQNLSIVVAPNLYDPQGADPLEGLVMSQKAVQFLHNVLLYKLNN